MPLHQSTQAWLAFAAFALLIGPTIAKRHPNARGMAYIFLGGMMFLPEVLFIKLPMMPSIDKLKLTNFVLLYAVFRLPEKRKAQVRWWWYAVMFGYLVQQAVTALNNGESLVYGQDDHRFVISGLTLKDGMFGTATYWTAAGLASYLGQRCFRTESDLETLIRVLACAGLVYAPLMLIEIRMSPQIHSWVYGYPANDAFDQTMRYGGYRPMVIMPHGLATALFLLTPTLAAAAAARSGMRLWRFSGNAAMWMLLVVLILAKSTAVWLYAGIALPLVRLASPKTINRVAAVLLVISCSYPYLRFSQTLPVDDVVTWFQEKFGQERAESLKFRFDNEDILIEHAMRKPWFGWSVNRGRNLLYDDWGKVVTITDGAWIIALGDGGIVGLILYYAFPVLAMFTVLRRSKRIRDERSLLFLATLNLCVAIHWIDILPNGAFNLLPEFLSGALCSVAVALSRKRKPVPEKKVAAPKPVPSSPIPSTPHPVHVPMSGH